MNTISHIQKKFTAHEKLTMLTAYDYTMARLVDGADIDMILVGDSLGNVFAGHDSTLPVTVEDMIYHGRAVVRGTQNALVVIDMPFLSYQTSTLSAKENAGRLIKETGAGAVKLEVNPSQLDSVKGIIDMGIPVMGHIGFTPQAVHQIGGYKIQGKTEEAAQELLTLAQELEKIGCFAVLMEMVPSSVSKTITDSLSIPTIGIGAGPHCSGQVLVTNDLLGLTLGKTAKFVKAYAQVAETSTTAIQAYKADVDSGQFPTDAHSY
ncbi:3-methyl-2-oxobutanoate hydroxymethyltransferase [bacterium]|jgi:3-methyl-2-oxobutanoate hydroxymethyltransferase|nr:3-methyl-2-oxobutanoate hydroxymethyltransferase [bacterium]